MANLTLVLGGIRSGKSLFAEQLVVRSQKSPIYIATAQIFDGETHKRVREHQERRTHTWLTVEEPIELVAALNAHDSKQTIILVDCLTLWLNNLLFYKLEPEEELSKLLDFLDSAQSDCVIVSSEVGSGVIPENPLARRYCDLVGLFHQEIAKLAECVYLVVAGLSLELKSVHQ